MSEISAYLQQNPPSPSSLQSLLSLSTRLLTGSLSFHSLFTSLRPFIVSETDSDRLQATRLIRQLLPSVIQILTPSEFSAIFGFFIDRIKDIIVIEETMQILLILLAFLAENPQKTTEKTQFFNRFLSVFSNTFLFFLPAYSQKVRYATLEILSHTLSSAIITDPKTQSEFLGVFLGQIDGEKDPRNLMKILKLLRKILDFFDKGLIKERGFEVFELLECYYPIAFNKPKNLRVTIEGGDLEAALNEGLFCEALFEKGWGLIREKAGEGVLENQIAALKSISFILEVFFSFFYDFCDFY